MHSMIKTVLATLTIGLIVSCSGKNNDSEVAPVDEGPELVPVTLENYKIAESDLAFNTGSKLVGTNELLHNPVDAFDLDNQTVVRMNRDTIYSGAILNVSEGATVTLPESDGRYISAMVVQNVILLFISRLSNIGL